MRLRENSKTIVLPRFEHHAVPRPTNYGAALGLGSLPFVEKRRTSAKSAEKTKSGLYTN